MDIIKSERIPRKWEWVGNQLSEHDGTEKLVKIACQIDEIVKKIYGEHTHTAQWILDMRVWEKSISLTAILDLSTKEMNCTPCSYTRALKDEEFKNCNRCEYAVLGGNCSQYDSEPIPLFNQFVDGLIGFKNKEDKR